MYISRCQKDLVSLNQEIFQPSFAARLGRQAGLKSEGTDLTCQVVVKLDILPKPPIMIKRLINQSVEGEMTRVVSATQARIRFGELIRQALETNEPITVERNGQPCVVVLSVEAYHRLKEKQARPDWQKVLLQIQDFRAQIQARRGGQPLPPPEEIIREMREERNAQLTSLS